MNIRVRAFFLVGSTGVLCACQTSPTLVFGQSHTVGISIGGSASDTGAELTLGYKDRDVAIVPVAIVPAKGTTGTTQMVNSTVGSASGTGQDSDALSVLGQFEVSAGAQSQNVGLGKFFATGLAAQKLADGFSCKLGSCADDGASSSGQPATASNTK